MTFGYLAYYGRLSAEVKKEEENEISYALLRAPQ
jgi:hypothetical protein